MSMSQKVLQYHADRFGVTGARAGLLDFTTGEGSPVAESGERALAMHPYQNLLGMFFDALFLSGLRKQVIKFPQVPFDDGKDRKSTRLNSSHLVISYAVFCLK